MPLAIEVKSRYLCTIMAGRFIRLFSMLIALSLAVGPAVGGARASSMGAKAPPVVMSDAGMPAGCDDCVGSKGGVFASACSIHCAGMTAVFFVVATIGDVAAGKLEYPALSTLSGQHVSPDPYPPRYLVLS